MFLLLKWILLISAENIIIMCTVAPPGMIFHFVRGLGQVLFEKRVGSVCIVCSMHCSSSLHFNYRRKYFSYRKMQPEPRFALFLICLAREQNIENLSCGHWNVLLVSFLAVRKLISVCFLKHLHIKVNISGP